MSQTGTTTTNPLVAFGEKITAFFKAKEAEVIQFADNFLPEVESDLEVGIEDIAELVGAAVIAEAPKVISGEEKFGNAVTSVTQQVEAGALGEGKTVALATVQAGVQAAYLTAQQIAAASKTTS